jgi:hypothetical protein
VARSTLKDFGEGGIELAVTFYRSVADANARALLDFLIDHPDERFDGAALARQLGFARHRDVARATYALGQLAADLGRRRPWREGQLGYLMDAAQADLLRRARDAGTGG